MKQINSMDEFQEVLQLDPKISKDPLKINENKLSNWTIEVKILLKIQGFQNYFIILFI